MLSAVAARKVAHLLQEGLTQESKTHVQSFLLSQQFSLKHLPWCTSFFRYVRYRIGCLCVIVQPIQVANDQISRGMVLLIAVQDHGNDCGQGIVLMGWQDAHLNAMCPVTNSAVPTHCEYLSLQKAMCPEDL